MKGWWKSLVLISVICLLAGISFAADSEYVGYARCKGCHSYQYKAWKDFKHAKASEALDEEQKQDPQCMSCHGTGAEQGEILEAVQCEACHGPGSLYMGSKIMSKSKYKNDPEGQHQLALGAGLVVQEESVCLKCHGQERPEGHPEAAPFNYEEAYGKVAHIETQE
jgi:DnaJ-class molecular chaperone